jgi:hypothetical protein
MRKTLKTSALALGILALTASAAFAGGGCSGAVTAQGHTSKEVAQIDQTSGNQTQVPSTQTAIR